MGKISILIATLFLTACGDIEVKTKDSNHTVTQTGSAYYYVTVRLEFIDQIKNLCQDRYIDQLSNPLYPQLVANCTFENLSLLNIDFGQIKATQDELCGLEYNNLTPDQKSVYDVICR